MIGFDIGKIIILCYKHYAKTGACMILFRIRQNSLFNKNNFNLSLNTALEVLLSILLERAFQTRALTLLNVLEHSYAVVDIMNIGEGVYVRVNVLGNLWTNRY